MLTYHQLWFCDIILISILQQVQNWSPKMGLKIMFLKLQSHLQGANVLERWKVGCEQVYWLVLQIQMYLNYSKNKKIVFKIGQHNQYNSSLRCVKNLWFEYMYMCYGKELIIGWNLNFTTEFVIHWWVASHRPLLYPLIGSYQTMIFIR